MNIGITIDTINDIAYTISSPEGESEQNLKDVLSWLTTTVMVDRMIYEIKAAPHVLVTWSPVKIVLLCGSTPLQNVDIHRGIEGSVIMIQHKLKRVEISIIREYDRKLPHINAYENELN